LSLSHLVLLAVCFSTHHPPRLLSLLLFFNDTATTEIYTLSLHDALPICRRARRRRPSRLPPPRRPRRTPPSRGEAASWSPRTTPDRKSTRLNSSHVKISYAVFCLKKKKKKNHTKHTIKTYKHTTCQTLHQ